MRWNVIVVAIAILVAGRSATASAKSSDIAPLANAAQIVQDMRSTIPDSVVDRAHCVAVIPKLKKAAFIVGGEHGSGVMSCRTGDTWGAPVFLKLTKGSFGLQAGISEVALVLLVMNEHGAEKLLSNGVSLGAGASIAAGPVGRQGEVATDASMTAEILSYSRAKGVFAGIDLSGGSLRPDGDANRHLYGKRPDLKAILASRPPAEASAFIAALPSPLPVTASTAAPEPPASLRIEELPKPERLAEAVAEPPVPTGTTGVSSAPRHRHARMPRTASPLALYELISGLAFAGAVGVRCLRKRIG
jgi:lipid-binding SYLF domain-containing protein